MFGFPDCYSPSFKCCIASLNLVRKGKLAFNTLTMGRNNKIELTQRKLDIIKKKELFLHELKTTHKLTEIANKIEVPLTTIRGWLNEDSVIREKYDAIIDNRMEVIGEIAEDRLHTAVENDKSGWLSLEVLRKRRKQHWGNDNNINLSANLIMNVPATMRKENEVEEAELLYNSEDESNQS